MEYFYFFDGFVIIFKKNYSFIWRIFIFFDRFFIRMAMWTTININELEQCFYKCGTYIPGQNNILKKHQGRRAQDAKMEDNRAFLHDEGFYIANKQMFEHNIHKSHELQLLCCRPFIYLLKEPYIWLSVMIFWQEHL